MHGRRRCLPVERGHRGSPGRVVDVVAQPVGPAILARLAGHPGHTRRTHVPYERFGRVDLGQEFVHVFRVQVIPKTGARENKSKKIQPL